MESLAALLQRKCGSEKTARLKELAPRIMLVGAYDTTRDGLLVQRDGGMEWFDADSIEPPASPLRLIVIRQSDGEASDSPYQLLEKVMGNIRKTVNGLCVPDWDGLFSCAYVTEQFEGEWFESLQSTSGTPERAAPPEHRWGVTKGEILEVTWPMPSNAPPLENILDEIPKWVDDACRKIGVRGKGAAGSHLWNPAILAVCLSTPSRRRKWRVGEGTLTNFLRLHFSEYLKEWEVATGKGE